MGKGVKIPLPGGAHWSVRRMGDTQRERLRKAEMTFRPILEVITQLRSGEVDCVRGRPVATDWCGDLMEISPVMEGWADCWERVSRHEGIPIDIAAIKKVATCLRLDVPMQPEQVEACARAIQACYDAYLILPKSALTKHIRAEQIAIELDAIRSLE